MPQSIKMTTFQDFLTLRIVICFWVFTVLSPAFNPVGQSQGVQRIWTCENDTMAIKCPVNATIQTVGIEYGQTFNGNYCDGKKYDGRRDACLSSRAQSTVNQRCEGKMTCSITVNKDTFNDRPCDSSVSIYLYVAYVCVPSFTAFTPTVTVTRRHTPGTPATVSETSVFSERLPAYSHCVGCVKCSRCRKRDITWPETPAGEWATARCPNNQNLSEARLLCGTDPVDWVGRPDLSRCTSTNVGDIQMQLENAEDLSIQSLDSFASELANYAEAEKSLAGGDLISISQSMYQVVKKFGMPASNETSHSVRSHVRHISLAVVKMTNSLLDYERRMSWFDVPRANWGLLATRLLRTVEASAFQMAKALTSAESRVNITKNILLEVHMIESGTRSSVKDIVFPNTEALKGSSWENTSDSFRLPAGALERNRRVKVLFVSYNNLENLLLPNSNRSFCSDLDDSEACDAVINTRIVSASIDSSGMKGSETLLQDPVVFTLEHKKTENVSNPICAFWKLHEGDEEGGEWSGKGCSVVSSNLTHTTCLCNHLTSFAVIMSPTSPELTAANALALDVLTYIGCIFSIICLFFSFLTFAYFRSLKCDRNTIHKNLVLCLFITNMIFLIGIDLTSMKIFCSVVAGLLHYFFLTVVAWMCIEGVQLYYMLVEVFEADKSHVLWFYLSAYGVPAAIVIISTSVDHHGYGTDRYCWLTTDKGFIWAFIGPAAAIILVNCVMLGIALRAMYRHTVSAATWRMKEKSRIQKIHLWVKGSAVLIVLLGLTWVFGLAFVNEGTVAFAYIFTILNCLQGSFIFIFHCLLNDKVQIEYKRCVSKAEWLPERFRVWYAGPKRSSYTFSPNQTSSSTGGWPWSRLLSRQRRNSQSPSVSRATSQKRPFLKNKENVEPNIVIASDSGFEDPSSYLESAPSHLGESEFNTSGLSSALEGSIIDTNYSEKFAKQPLMLQRTGRQ